MERQFYRTWSPSGGRAPVTRINLEYSQSPRTGLHVITSPDVKGFRATGRTLDEAQREARAVLDILQKTRFGENEVLKAVEYAAA